MSNPNFDPLTDALEAGVKDLLNNLIDGSIEALDGPVREISQRLTMAARRGSQDLVDMCVDHLALVALEEELVLEAEGDSIFVTALNSGVNILVNIAIGGLKANRS